MALVAEDEFNVGKVRVKDLRGGDMQSRAQVDVPIEDMKNVLSYFKPGNLII